MAWRWLNKNVLIETHGSRNVVMSPDLEGNMQQCGEDGTLEDFDPRGVNGKLIKHAPDFREALKNFLDLWTLTPIQFAELHDAPMDHGIPDEMVTKAKELLEETEDVIHADGKL